MNALILKLRSLYNKHLATHLVEFLPQFLGYIHITICMLFPAARNLF